MTSGDISPCFSLPKQGRSNNLERSSPSHSGLSYTSEFAVLSTTNSVSCQSIIQVKLIRSPVITIRPDKFVILNRWRVELVGVVLSDLFILNC